MHNSNKAISLGAQISILKILVDKFSDIQRKYGVDYGKNKLTKWMIFP